MNLGSKRFHVGVKSSDDPRVDGWAVSVYQGSDDGHGCSMGLGKINGLDRWSDLETLAPRLNRTMVTWLVITAQTSLHLPYLGYLIEVIQYCLGLVLASNVALATSHAFYQLGSRNLKAWKILDCCFTILCALCKTVLLTHQEPNHCTAYQDSLQFSWSRKHLAHKSLTRSSALCLDCFHEALAQCSQGQMIGDFEYDFTASRTWSSLVTKICHFY